MRRVHLARCAAICALSLAAGCGGERFSSKQETNSQLPGSDTGADVSPQPSGAVPAQTLAQPVSNGAPTPSEPGSSVPSLDVPGVTTGDNPTASGAMHDAGPQAGESTGGLPPDTHSQATVPSAPSTATVGDPAPSGSEPTTTAPSSSGAPSASDAPSTPGATSDVPPTSDSLITGETTSEPATSTSVGETSDEATLANDAGTEPTGSVGEPCEWQPFSAPERLTGLRGNDTLWGSSVSADGQLLVFASNDGNDERIVYATRSGRDAAFGSVSLVAGVNSDAQEGSPFLSTDGQTLYFFSTQSDRSPLGRNAQRDLWRATRTPGDFAFARAEPISELNTESTDQMPWLSDDELTLVFTSDRSDGAGAHDLWQAKRDSRDHQFGAAMNLAELNTSLNEEGASLSADLLTIFYVSGTSSTSSDFDIYTATRANAGASFGPAAKVTELNSSGQELYASLSHDGRELFFASNRSGPSELWHALRQCQ